MKSGLKSVLSLLAGAAAGSIIMKKALSESVQELREHNSKIQALYRAYDQWLCLRQEGKTLNEYFKCNGYQKIAIYGMKELGERLYD